MEDYEVENVERVTIDPEALYDLCVMLNDPQVIMVETTGYEQRFFDLRKTVVIFQHPSLVKK